MKDTPYISLFFFTKEGESRYSVKNRLRLSERKKILSAFGVRFFFSRISCLNSVFLLMDV